MKLRYLKNLKSLNNQVSRNRRAVKRSIIISIDSSLLFNFVADVSCIDAIRIIHGCRKALLLL